MTRQPLTDTQIDDLIGFTFFGILFLIIIVGAFLIVKHEDDKCQDAGGVAVRGVCIDRDAVVKP